MAKTLGMIRMEYDKAMKQAEKLDQIAADLRRVADQRFTPSLSRINRAWKSDSSVKFVRKGNKLAEEIRTRAKEIEKAAKTVRTIARNTYNAEMRARQIAKERTYN